ncbi:Protein of unknown function DUF262 [Nitrosospira multiformis]|uniref:GmrSD restriction endonucleases N-terminal domain-containing protein n=1 Tax=Nitrosospira multiformis TaxID=1231 RepID=A0A1I0FQQ3_9PROT|nr:Protein of unknown function DUF262 [Nitrosospira multiformis]
MIELDSGIKEKRVWQIENPQVQHIEEAFRECFCIFRDYQREYVWTDKEVHQLLEDINEQIDAASTREYFIDTVLVPRWRSHGQAGGARCRPPAAQAARIASFGSLENLRPYRYLRYSYEL